MPKQVKNLPAPPKLCDGGRWQGCLALAQDDRVRVRVGLGGIEIPGVRPGGPLENHGVAFDHTPPHLGGEQSRTVSRTITPGDSDRTIRIDVEALDPSDVVPTGPVFGDGAPGQFGSTKMSHFLPPYLCHCRKPARPEILQ